MKIEEFRASNVWSEVRRRLDAAYSKWPQLIDHYGQVAAVERRIAGHKWSDDQVFEALLRAVLSSNTDWDRVESVLPELRDAFRDFSLGAYAAISDTEVDQRLVPWFKARKAGSVSLKKNLKYLAKAARKLIAYSASSGSAERYFLDAVNDSGGDAKRAAIALGTLGSTWKLPALGISIAAESLRNMGFDICKPSGHICRAVGSFGLVQFRRWPDRSGTKAPAAHTLEMLETMETIETLAANLGLKAVLLDNALWLICARNREVNIGMSNADLAAMASQAGHTL